MKSLLLFAVFSVATYSLARPLDSIDRDVKNAKPENGLYSDSMNKSQQSGRNPKNKKKFGSSKSQKKSHRVKKVDGIL